MFRVPCLCLMVALSTISAQAADPLAKVTSLHIQYQANAEIEGCKAIMAQAMSDQGIKVASSPAQADAIYRIKLDVKKGAMRSSLRWGATLEDHKGKRLFSDYGEESSWTAKAACKDLADDLAEDLKDDIRNARLLGF